MKTLKTMTNSTLIGYMITIWTKRTRKSMDPCTTNRRVLCSSCPFLYSNGWDKAWMRGINNYTLQENHSLIQCPLMLIWYRGRLPERYVTWCYNSIKPFEWLLSYIVLVITSVVVVSIQIRRTVIIHGGIEFHQLAIL